MHHRIFLVPLRWLQWLLLPALLHLVIVPGAAAAPETEILLDVGLVLFDPGIPKDASSHSRLGVYPEIRKSEARYMPVFLRDVLVNSGAWGVVRVLPEVLDTSELLVSAEILQSDGQRLELSISTVDATGRVWFERVYSEIATAEDYPVAPESDPFVGLYQRLGADMLTARDLLSAAQLREIRQVALLRYAQSLAPGVFDGYVEFTEEGRYVVARLPADGDPMMARIDRIRNQEFLFIDTVDEQYSRLSAELAPTYHLWRQFDQEQALYREDYAERVAGRDSRGSRGSYAAMEQTYNAYKWSKIHVQDLDELALGFNNEVAPTVMEVNGQVFKLSGSLETQYGEWRDILQRIFTLETGLSPQ